MSFSFPGQEAENLRPVLSRFHAISPGILLHKIQGFSQVFQRYYDFLKDFQVEWKSQHYVTFPCQHYAIVLNGHDIHSQHATVGKARQLPNFIRRLVGQYQSTNWQSLIRHKIEICELYDFTYDFFKSYY